MVGRPASSAGSSQHASLSSSFRTGSPKPQCAAKQRITKWRSTRCVGVAHDGLAKARQRHRLDDQAGFFAHLARDRLFEGLAELDHAAGQGVQPMGRRPCAADHEHLAAPHDGGAHRQERSLRIRSWIRHCRLGLVF